MVAGRVVVSTEKTEGSQRLPQSPAAWVPAHGFDEVDCAPFSAQVQPAVPQAQAVAHVQTGLHSQLQF